MKKISEEAKTEFFEDVDDSIHKCAIEIYNALTKMLVKACPEKTEETKAFVQEHRDEFIAILKNNLIGDGCDFEEAIRLIFSIVRGD